MSEAFSSPRGQVIVVVTPNDDAEPSYRTYLVAEDDRTKALLRVARYIRVDEIAYPLGPAG
jgi:hypothetical protein